MARPSIRRAATLILAASLSAQALQVTPDSDCAALCMDSRSSDAGDSKSSSTSPSDIVCEDGGYSMSSEGIKYKNCLNCLQDSSAMSGTESDVYWYLYNLRYAFDVCLYTYPDAGLSQTVNSPCNIDGGCAELQDALETSLKDVNGDDHFGYCDASNSIINSDSYTQCTQCLQSSQQQTYLSNFLIALKAGCDQRPAPGTALALEGDLFSSTKVNSTAQDTSNLPGKDGAKSGAMTTGTIVGIAVGCGLCFIGAVFLIFVYCRRQRRLGGEKLDSPDLDDPRDPITSTRGVSYYPSHKMSESISSYREFQPAGHGRKYSNADFYDKLEDDARNGHVQNLNYHFAPHSRSNGPGGALPAHPAYIPRVVSRSSVGAPTPPNPAALAKSNTPDSYALQIYLSANDDSSIDASSIPTNLDAHHSRSSSRESRHPSLPQQPAPVGRANAPLPPPPPMPRAPPLKLKIPSLVMPSVLKLKTPKKYEPPTVVVQDPTPISAVDPRSDLRISRPLAILDSRFKDQPLGGGPVLATEAPKSMTESAPKKKKKEKYVEEPMLSGTSSRLYG